MFASWTCSDPFVASTPCTDGGLYRTSRGGYCIPVSTVVDWVPPKVPVRTMADCRFEMSPCTSELCFTSTWLFEFGTACVWTTASSDTSSPKTRMEPITSLTPRSSSQPPAERSSCRSARQSLCVSAMVR